MAVNDGTRYIMTANEGDARDYDGFAEEADVKDITRDAGAFPNARALQDDSALGDLDLTTTARGDYDRLYAFGARWFSIRRADDASLVYASPSGNQALRAVGNDVSDSTTLYRLSLK